jgi:hypothetical protein
MGKRILHPEWRKENEPTKYPFGSNASLTNGVDVFIEGLFLDAVLYPIGGQARMYISKVELTHEDVTITIGDPSNPARATGTFDLINPPDRFKLADVYGRPAGVIVSETLRLSTFQSWTVGEHLFSVDQTELAATVCIPTPEVGVRGILLDDGTLFTGDTYIIGDDGVALNTQVVEEPGPCGSAGIPVTVIRVDIVGDPLFRRRLCDPNALFVTPRFIRTITFDDGKQQVKCGPNDVGDLKMTANNELAEDTVLRIRMTDGGIVIRAEGTTLSGVR